MVKKPDIDDVICHLQRIATVNDDEFEFNIRIDPHLVSERYLFDCVGMSGIEFLKTTAYDLDKLISNINNEIRPACMGWDYQYVG